MTIVDRTRELEPLAAGARSAGTGRPRSRCSTESERLFAETGRYCGVDELALKEADPIRYEKIFSRLRGGLVTARETALNISRQPDRQGDRRALLRALHARGRLGRALDRDHRPRPHDVRRDQVHDPPGLRGRTPGSSRATSSPTTTR